MGILPTQFEFLPGEITVRSIFRHLKTHEVTGEIVEDWFVVIPQLLSLSINYKSIELALAPTVRNSTRMIGVKK